MTRRVQRAVAVSRLLCGVCRDGPRAEATIFKQLMRPRKRSCPPKAPPP
eukprot:gene2917-3461_t